ncbi:oligosaccharide flippase family protein [Flavobacteriaceae bacterium]|nr:oligosaccharide flippase family protein [Flavobacteriaceae bacterium]
MGYFSKIKNLLKQNIFLVGASALAKFFDIIRGVIFLKIFSPFEFGVIDIVNQIISISKYGDIGFLDNTKREYNYDYLKTPILATEKKNASYGYDLILSVIMFFIILSSTFFIEDTFIIQTGIVFGAFSFLSQKIIKILNLEMTLKKDFSFYTKFSIILTLVQNIFILTSVYFIGIYAPLVMKSISLLIVAIYGLNMYPLNLKFKLEFKYFLSQIKFGLVFSGFSILFGIWIFFERFIITKYFSLAEVGIYAACLFVLKAGGGFLDEFIKPISINVKESLSNFNIDIIKKYVLYPSVIFLCISPLLIYFAQTLFNFLEGNILSNYPGIGGYFSIISFLIPVYGIGSISGYLLLSKGVDKFTNVYGLYFFRFLFLAFLCYCKSPQLFDTLLLYIVTVELFFFYGKQFFIFSSFFDKWITLIISIGLFTINLSLINLF